ncbi:hypothetical protein [Thiomicrospira cyclica]|uniref:Uncharacterized protein n=1 Tax=Thiomicrospira cyclica (strain DSM 14477 / JCM 11371 / ALM1) TaxID=717773 RepID=F6DCG1_THICA|nr:hypothetical protein [Thiomicrospira cyclica]AEG31547.1 hypothetical protein Thicy_0775 [Thiomicrospira cyclica ALM1]
MSMVSVAQIQEQIEDTQEHLAGLNDQWQANLQNESKLDVIEQETEQAERKLSRLTAQLELAKEQEEEAKAQREQVEAEKAYKLAKKLEKEYIDFVNKVASDFEQLQKGFEFEKKLHQWRLAHNTAKGGGFNPTRGYDAPVKKAFEQMALIKNKLAHISSTVSNPYTWK